MKAAHLLGRLVLVIPAFAYAQDAGHDPGADGDYEVVVVEESGTYEVDLPPDIEDIAEAFSTQHGSEGMVIGQPGASGSFAAMTCLVARPQTYELPDIGAPLPLFSAVASAPPRPSRPMAVSPAREGTGAGVGAPPSSSFSSVVADPRAMAAAMFVEQDPQSQMSSVEQTATGSTLEMVNCGAVVRKRKITDRKLALRYNAKRLKTIARSQPSGPYRVPEPGSLVLVAIGIAGIMLTRPNALARLRAVLRHTREES